MKLNEMQVDRSDNGDITFEVDYVDAVPENLRVRAHKQSQFSWLIDRINASKDDQFTIFKLRGKDAAEAANAVRKTLATRLRQIGYRAESYIESNADSSTIYIRKLPKKAQEKQ